MAYAWEEEVQRQRAQSPGWQTNQPARQQADVDVSTRQRMGQVEAAERPGRASDELKFQAELDALDAAREKRWQDWMVSQRTSSGGGGAGGGPKVSMPPIQGYSPGGGYEAARSAAYGRAKDEIGQSTGAALRDVGDIMSARGLLGTGAEAQAIGDVYGQAQGALGEVGRDIATQRERRAAEVEDALAKMAQERTMGEYEGGIRMRGQDIDAQIAREQMWNSLMQSYRERQRQYLF